MGVNTDAGICFGVDFGEELPEYFEQFEDEDDDGWGAPYNFNEQEGLPVEIITHCSGDFPYYILAFKNTEHSACRGYPVTIEPHTLKVKPESIQKMKDFFKQADIEWQAPSWLLYSYWG